MTSPSTTELTAADPSGLVIIDKPSGPTSHDVVQRLRRIFRTRRVGHAGTLDPMASGVLIGLVGEATKLAPYATGHAKHYITRVAFGRSTDTLDAEGATVDERPAALPPARVIEAALAVELARTEQVPPAFSAIRQDGKRSYDLARAGLAPILPARAVHVRALRLLLVEASDAPFVDVELEVGAGYFVRSFARDLGAALGLPAHMAALRRVASGPFTLDEAVRPDEEARVTAALLPMADAARKALPSAQLTEDGRVRARQGKRLDATDFVEAPTSSGPAAWFDAEGELIAIGHASEDGWAVLRGFQAR